MRSFSRICLAFIAQLITLALLTYAAAVAAEPFPNEHQSDHIKVRLVTDRANLAIGETIAIGALFTLEPGWHIYGSDPGEIGLPTTVSWQEQPGYLFGSTPWPPTTSFSYDGVQSNTYADTVLLPATVTTEKVGSTPLSATVSWVLCKDECIPGSAELSIPIADGVVSSAAFHSAAFQHGSTPSTASESASLAQAAQNVEVSGGSPFLAAACFAFVGGFILNFMPCVFPILSLKVIHLLKHGRGESARLHMGVFALGVISSFMALAGVLLAVRSVGTEVGWGFQFQSPAFIVVMAFVIFVMGLSLAGVFEFGYSVQTFAGSIAIEPTYRGSFLNGVLATALATPCTAPFMSSAIAFALSAAVLHSMLVFFSLALGMASPYLAFAAVPQLGKLLPRPGAWMDTLKQALSFPLFATVVWLLWVLGAQNGNNAVACCGIGLVLLSIGFWSFGKWGKPSASRRARRTARLSVTLSVALAVSIGVPLGSAATSESVTSRAAPHSQDDWEPFTTARFHELLAQKQNVVVDFTAAWCAVCQINEARVFRSAEVRATLQSRNFRLVKADWTSQNKEITEALRSLGKAGVPLVVVYTADKPPVLFDGLISPATFLSSVG